jgi:hypothetical protein
MQEREIPPVHSQCESSDGGTTEHHIKVGRGSDPFNTAMYVVADQCRPHVCAIAAVTIARWRRK